MIRPIGLDCFIYLRKSRKDVEVEKSALARGEIFDTLKRHRQQLMELARRERHNVVEIFEEVVSGEYISDRPQIQRMLRELEAGVADAVLVMDLDRLGRGDMVDMGTIFRILQYSETMVITPGEVIDPTSEGAELLFGVKSILSREELKGITRRLQRGRRVSAKEGKSITKKPPYGYRRDENLKLYPDPETAWVVQYIFRRMTEGAGRIQIGQELDRMGVKPPDKEKWCPSTITAILKNEVYLGHIIWGKVRYIKRNGRYIRKKVPPDQWVICYNAHEPLVSEEKWLRANEEHSHRWRPPKHPTKPLSNPLAGLVRCGNCGHSLWKMPRQDRRDQIRCVNPACKGIQRGAVFELVEQRILEGLQKIVREFELNSREVQQQEEENIISFKQAQLRQLQKEMDELQKQKHNLHDFLERGIYTVDVFMERNRIVADKIKTVQDQIDQVNQEIEQEEMKERNKNEIIPKIKTVIAEYHETDDPQRKNRLLKSVLEKAVYFRKKEWKGIDQFEIDLCPLI